MLAAPRHKVAEVLAGELHRRGGPGGWLIVHEPEHRDDARVPPHPFDAVELDLAISWADVEP